MGNIIQSIPEAKLLLASLRSVGYTEETAIADIVDNCISAKAKHIDIIFETDKMRILILDDGIGMTAQALIENMRIGSSDPSKQRDDTDLGRFGMGMKTAAFSLGKRLTVVTRFEETTSNAAWDLDKIPDIGWNLIIEESDSIAEISSRLGAQGTVVCIENLALPKGHFDADEYRTVKDAISDLEDVKPVVDLADDRNGIVLQPKENLSELASSLRNSLILRNHMVTKTTDTAMERFCALKQGQNFHSLKDSMKTNTYTDAARTQNTIYLRLNYDEPSGTVVNVRKSMWIHPTQDRAISVREAARLQTFPDSFVFCGSKDKQYQQVGNAVPPIMAKSIAEKLAQILEKNLAGRERNG